MQHFFIKTELRFSEQTEHISGQEQVTGKTHLGGEEFLEMIVHPHLDLEPLPDQRHLVSPVLGRQELFPLLFTNLTKNTNVAFTFLYLNSYSC